jgi:Tfp pilus assembly protein PilX
VFRYTDYMEIFSSFVVVQKKASQSGQAALVVLLLTVILLTIGIAVASRATTDVALSRQEEESNRALNAAESGVEDALTQDLDFSGNTFSGSVTVDSNVAVNYTIEKVYVLETRLFKGVSAQADVTGVTNGQGIQIRWAKETSCAQNPASLLVTVFRRVGVNIRSRTYAYKPCATPNNGFTQNSTDPTGELFRQVTLNLQTGDLFVRIKPIYKDTYVQVQGSGSYNLPIQYYRVKSVAQSNLGDEVRAVQVNRTKPVAPSIFDFFDFSGTTLTQ